MSQDPNREFDRTSLRVMTYDGVHRDYAAHFFRWAFIQRLVKRDDRVLDIGCGVQAPLARILQNSEGSLSMLPSYYLGVDINKKPARPFGVKWAEFRYDFNFARDWKNIDGRFNVITCLEVVEHMTMPNVLMLLRGAGELAAPGARLVLSTPVANRRPAKNHINEMTVVQLAAAFDGTGWRVEERFGTFASHGDIVRAADKEHVAIMEKIRAYYGGAVAACFLAPLYPDASRNNVWICRRADEIDDLL